MTSRTRGAILWLVVFVLGALFQFWRRAPVDTLAYSLVALFVLVSAQKKFRTPQFGAIRFSTTVIILLVSTTVFIFSPIHSWLATVFYLILAPVALRVAWQQDFEPLRASDAALRRSSRIWFVIGSLTCISELGNYFASDYTHDDKAFPTITVLVDPIVAETVGKTIFVVIWAAIGVGLSRVSTAK